MSNLFFDVLSKKDVEIIRKWRNEDLSFLRTPFFLTEEMQIEFYDKIICDRYSRDRYFALRLNLTKELIGCIGLTNISLENRNSEISLILGSNYRDKGYGKETLLLLLRYGFNYLNLKSIFGECYTCSPHINFWIKMIETFNADFTYLKSRKFYNNKYYDSLYFTFDKDVCLDECERLE